MLGGLPVEMITMLGSSILGGVMSMWSQSIKAKQEQQKLLMETEKLELVHQIQKLESEKLTTQSLLKNFDNKNKNFNFKFLQIIFNFDYTEVFKEFNLMNKKRKEISS